MPKPIIVRAPRGAKREVFVAAAYRLIGAAYVRLDDRGGALRVMLTPRTGAAVDLAEEFRGAYTACLAAAARRRRAGERDAAVMSRALTMADRVDARRREPLPALPPERLAEIESLLAESEKASPDSSGLRIPWDQLRGGGG